MTMMNGFMGSIIPEMEQIISQLERGTIITRFYPRKKPERKTLMVRRETRQLLWARTATRTFEGSSTYYSAPLIDCDSKETLHNNNVLLCLQSK